MIAEARLHHIITRNRSPLPGAEQDSASARLLDQSPTRTRSARQRAFIARFASAPPGSVSLGGFLRGRLVVDGVNGDSGGKDDAVVHGDGGLE